MDIHLDVECPPKASGLRVWSPDICSNGTRWRKLNPDTVLEGGACKWGVCDGSVETNRCSGSRLSGAALGCLRMFPLRTLLPEADPMGPHGLGL